MMTACARSRHAQWAGAAGAFGIAATTSFLVRPLSASAAGSETPRQGVQRVVVKEGTGVQPKRGQVCEVHYTGRLEKGGKVFDSSVGRGSFKFRVGMGEVIRGWDEGVIAMKVGEKCVLTIQPDYGYGRRGAGGVIPPDAVLIFEVELLSVQ